MPICVKRWREFKCEDCGKPTRRRRATIDPLICLDCGIARGAKAAREMHDKAGPAYDAFQASRGPLGRPRSTKE